MISFIKKMTGPMMCGFYSSLGAAAYLIIPNRTVATLFFALGIWLVINFHKQLFIRVIPVMTTTGKFDIKEALFALLGNTIGVLITATLMSFTRVMAEIHDTVGSVVDARLGDNFISLLILSIFCGMVVAYAVLTSSKQEKGSFAQIFYAGVFIAAFVFCGFENYIVNVYFFMIYGYAYEFSMSLLSILGIVLIGNIIGGLFIGFVEKKHMEDKV